MPPEQENADEQLLAGMGIDPTQTSKRTAALKARMNIAAEAAIGDDIDGLGGPSPGSVSFSNNRNSTLNDYHRKTASNNNYGNMNTWQLNSHNMIK